MWDLFKTKPIPEDGQMELMEHLAELRSRIFRAILYLIVGMVVTYSLYPFIFQFLSLPVNAILHHKGFLVVNNIADGFLLRMQVCFISGLAVAFPLVVLELWGFIAPALTDNERKPITYLAPFSVLLFLAGAATGYACLPATYGWMGGFIDDIPGAQLMQGAQQYILLTLKILLGFGISFELPLVLLFLARVGLLTADWMVKYWRHAVVGISIAAAVLTPSADPFTMLMMAIPMAGLYLLSIGLVRAFQPREDGTRTFSLGAMLSIALAPVAILIAVGFWVWKTMFSPALAVASGPTPVVTGSPTAPGATPTPGGATPAAATDQDIEALRQENAKLRERLDAVEAKLNALSPAPTPAPSPSPFDPATPLPQQPGPEFPPVSPNALTPGSSSPANHPAGATHTTR